MTQVPGQGSEAAPKEALQAQLLSQLQQVLGSFCPGSPAQWLLLRACLDQQVGFKRSSLIPACWVSQGREEA